MTRPPVVAIVEPDPLILSGLRRVLRRQRAWTQAYAGSLEELQATGLAPDVLVACDPDPARLRNLMAEGHAVLRMCLSDAEDSRAVAGSASWAHRYLVKPCPTPVIVEQLEDLCRLWSSVSPESLRVASTNGLPASPALYEKVRRAVDDPDVGLHRVAELVEMDPASASQVLKLVNSPFFGGSRRISAVADAVKRLGGQVVRDLVLSSAIGGPHAARLQQHALAVAGLTRRMPCDTGPAFTAALLHDVGLAMMEDDGHPDDASHGALGAFVLAAWGLDPAVVHAVRDHHDPEAEGLAATVQIADRIVHEVCSGVPDCSLPAFAARHGVSAKLLAQLRDRAACR